MASEYLILAQAAGQGTAPTPPSGAQQAPPSWGMLPMLLFMGAAMYLLLIRPQQKQKKEHQKLLSQIRSGDKIVTSGGIYGTVANVKDKTFVIRIADGVKIELDKANVGRVVEKSPDSSAEEAKPK
jgi:preprotein translocase subunit YajC